MKTLTKAALAVSMMAVCGGAMGAVEPDAFYFCDPNPANVGGPKGDGCTGVFFQNGANTGAESYYRDVNSDGGISVGDAAVDQGDGTSSTLIHYNGTDGFGLELAGYSAGGTWRLDYKYDDITAGILLVDDSVALFAGNNPNGIGVVGERIQAGGVFGAGAKIRFYYDTNDGTLNNEELAFTVVITSGTAAAANVELNGIIDFTGSEAVTGAMGRFAQARWQDMFWICDNVDRTPNPPTCVGNYVRWYDMWLAYQADPANNPPVTWRFDTNIDPAFVLAGGVPSNPAFAAYTDFRRASTLNGSVIYRVPEPASLFLLAGTLVGVGRSKWKRRQMRKARL